MTRNFIPCPTVLFRRDCLTRVGLLDHEAIGIEDWDLWVRIAELYPVLAMDQTAAIWRRSTSTSRQLTSRPEKLHQHSRRLHQPKWMKLPRATDADERKRREATQAFERIAAQQLIWESASRFKARRSKDFVLLGFATARMYPGAVIKTAFETKTWRSISKLGQAVDYQRRSFLVRTVLRDRSVGPMRSSFLTPSSLKLRVTPLRCYWSIHQLTMIRSSRDCELHEYLWHRLPRQCSRARLRRGGNSRYEQCARSRLPVNLSVPTRAESSLICCSVITIAAASI